jgi:hypothetical protein
VACAALLTLSACAAPVPQPAPKPDWFVTAAAGDQRCSNVQGCTGSRLVSVFNSIHDGHHEWEATYSFGMQPGPAVIEVDDLDPATGQILRRVDSWSATQP